MAIIPFEYVDGHKSAGGLTISEELTNRIVKLHKLTVIERTLVEKLLEELKFQRTGAVDPQTAQEIGKGLGVEAIITGTLADVDGRNVRVNSRVIKTESYEIVASASARLKKTWHDAPVPEMEQNAGGQPSQPVRQVRRGSFKGYVDFFLGTGSSKMDLSFRNNSSTIDQSELAFAGVSPNPFRSISFENLATKGGIPLGLRLGGFGDVFGGAMEISYFSQELKPQQTTYKLNGIPRGSWQFFADPYLTVSVFNLLSGDLMIRFPTSDTVYPYIGLGLGLTLNTVNSQFAKMLRGAALQETTAGFMFRIPFGLRFNIADKFGLFVEGRYYRNSFSFTRNRTSEDDEMVLKGMQFLTGLSLLF